MSELYLDHPAAAADPAPSDGRWTATIVSAAPLLARQDGGATSLVVLNGMPDRQHVIGDKVKLQRFGSDLVIMAALTARPQFGTVSSVSTGPRTAQVATSAGTWTVQYIGAAPTVTDRVALFWGPEGGVILGSASTTVTPPASTDPGGAGSAPLGGGTLTVNAAQGATYRSGAKRTDVGTKLYQGHWTTGNVNNNSGIFCYGDVFGGLAGKTIVSAKLTFTRGPRGTGDDGAVTITVVAHGQVTPPSATPAYSGSVTVNLAPNQTTSPPVDVTSIAAGLANGTVRGFGISYAGTAEYAAILGPDELPGTGTLTVVYA